MQSNREKIQFHIPLRIMLGIFCCLLILLGSLIVAGTTYTPAAPEEAPDVSIIASFDALVSEALSQAEEAARSVKKRFWLSADAEKGPVPDPEKFGTSSDPSSLQWLLDEAQELLDGEVTLFSTETVLRPGSKLTYYLDDSIFAVTWKQVMDGSVYTISEIKISDPSQFRRHIEDSVFDGPKLSTPSRMSQKVNAVVGASADHYRGRRAGIIVYDGEVKRIDKPDKIDICYIDTNGDLHFSYRGQLMDSERAQQFVDANDISFSIAFGPVLIDNGIRCEPPTYTLGEINDNYARAALCQMGELHYLVVTANAEPGYWASPDLHEFAACIETFGCQKAYTLDGGNTGSIVVNGKLVNRTPFGYERSQGDIIYFCTAIPDQID